MTAALHIATHIFACIGFAATVVSVLAYLAIGAGMRAQDRLHPTSSHPQQGDADVRGEGGGGSIHEGTSK